MDPTKLFDGNEQGGSSLGSDSTGGSLLDDLANHQTFLIIAGVVVVHLGLLAWAAASLWRQTPKQSVAYKYGKMD